MPEAVKCSQIWAGRVVRPQIPARILDRLWVEKCFSRGHRSFVELQCLLGRGGVLGFQNKRVDAFRIEREGTLDQLNLAPPPRVESCKTGFLGALSIVSGRIRYLVAGTIQLVLGNLFELLRRSVGKLLPFLVKQEMSTLEGARIQKNFPASKLFRRRGFQ